jgi:hypothetical protein
MSEIQTDIDRNRRHRGSILRVVRRYGTQGISWPGLERIFRSAGLLGAVEMLEENVQYLADKAYLKKARLRDEIAGVERWMLYIAPSGIDLIEGTIDPDPGVNLIV